MENYRTKLKHQNVILAISAMALMITQILAYMRVIKPDAGDSHWLGAWNGFIAGAAFAIMAFAIFGFVKNIIALKNTDKLKKQYVKDNDERILQIQEKGGFYGASGCLRSMPAIIIISGYFNVIISVTCICITLLLGISMVIGKIYYSKKL